jgi:copper oxidase (laccase) domain-containing protein
MAEFVIDESKGIGYFKSLTEDLNAPNLVTYDNEKWGNMSPYYAQSEDEREEIENKDEKIREMLGIKRTLAMTTPPENTLIEVNNNVLKSLFIEEKTSIPIRANAVIVSEKLKNDYGVVMAPKDCAAVVIKSKDSDIAAILHIGAPQIMQGLHKQVVRYLKTLVSDLSNYYVYIFPHITAENYKLSEEKLKILDDDLRKYLGEENAFDFILALKDYLTATTGISNFFDSDIDSYEAARNGKMYSHTLEKELDEKGKSFNKGAHNVVTKI